MEKVGFAVGELVEGKVDAPIVLFYWASELSDICFQPSDPLSFVSTFFLCLITSSIPISHLIK